MKEPPALPLLYPAQSPPAPGEGQVGTWGPTTHLAVEAAWDARASNRRACKASGWGLNQAAPAVWKIIAPITKRCWEDKSANVRAIL